MKNLTLSPVLTPSLSIPHWLTLTLWFTTAILTVGLFVIDQVTDYADLQVACDGGWTLTEDSPCNTLAVGSAEQVVLESWGLSLRHYATAMKLEAVVVLTVYMALALLLLWRQGHTRLGLMVSLALVVFPLNIFSAEVQWGAIHPVLEVPGTVIANLTQLVIIPFFYLLPNGRLPTRWAYIPMSLTIALLVAGLFGIERLAGVIPWLGTAFGIGMVSLLIIGAGLQIYRYVKTSDRVERQQTKWILGGILCFVISVLLWVYSYSGAFDIAPGTHRLLVNVVGAFAQGVLLCALPVAITIAILRYRLWNIDLIFNRTLVFGGLTAIIVLVYSIMVGGFSLLFQSSGNFFVSLVATAVVAIIFQPVREQLQDTVNRLMFGERDNPYTVLSRLGQHLQATTDPQETLSTVAETIASTLKLPFVAVELIERDEQIGRATVGKTLVQPANYPLHYQQEIVGRLQVSPRSVGENFTLQEHQLLTDIAAQLGPVASATRLTLALQHSREQLVMAREEERRRIRRDLHDGLGPTLAAQTLKLDSVLELLIENNTVSAEKHVQQLKSQTQIMVADIRRLVYELRPPALDELGLVEALQAHVAQMDDKRSPLHISIASKPDLLPPLPAAVEVAAYRIALESVTNVIRHAKAQQCEVQLVIARDDQLASLTLTVIDDGIGLSSDFRSGVGLVSMRERAEELGGRCEVISKPNTGTHIIARLPYVDRNTP